MKKTNILILILFIIILIITIIQFFNISLTTGISGFPKDVTLADVQRGQIITVVGNNLIIFIITSLLIIFINRFFCKKK